MDNMKKDITIKELSPEQENFREWVKGCNDNNEAHAKTNRWLIAALICTNLFWAAVLAISIWFAYMTPTTYDQSQTQDFPQQTQSQANKGAVS